MKKPEGLELIKAYRDNPENYYPLPDITARISEINEYGEVDIGWNAGLLDEKRPFFAEYWAVDGITMLTMFVSTEGIEDMTAEELDQWFQRIGYYKQRDPESNLPDVRIFTDNENKEFFSINLIVGVEDEPARIDGAQIWPWRVFLNKQ